MRFLSRTAVLKRLRGAKAGNDQHIPALPAGDYQPTDAEIATELYAAGQAWRGALMGATS